MGSVIKGKTNEPPRILVYGSEGIGKSTFAAEAPSPIFVQTEDGLGQIDCAKFPLAKSYDEVVTDLKGVRDEEHDYKTVVIDSLDWLETLIFEQVCRYYGCKSIEKADGGFGHGYQHARDYWKQILELLNGIRKRGMIVILIAHQKEETYKDPEHPDYDRNAPQLNKLAAHLINAWVDAIFFATRRMRYDSETGKATPVGANGGERIIRACGQPACIAKSRYAIDVDIPLHWQSFVDAVNGNGKV